MTRVFRSIPAVDNTHAPQMFQQHASAVKHNVDRLTGRSAAGQDTRAVTVQDLLLLGIITQTQADTLRQSDG